jgi:electron transfer flavoprotein beta subunit
MKINELDEHAIEQAILLKERIGGEVTVVGMEGEGVEDALFAAAAKGADHLIKLLGSFEGGLSSHDFARILSTTLSELEPDLILTGVQAHDNLDGSVGPLLAEFLEMPYLGYVAGVSIQNGSCLARKEFPGGLIAEMEVKLPAVLGIQAADTPPRYVAISKIRQAMKTVIIETRSVEGLAETGPAVVDGMTLLESPERATMIEGDEYEVANKILELLREMDVL